MEKRVDRLEKMIPRAEAIANVLGKIATDAGYSKADIKKLVDAEEEMIKKQNEEGGV